MEGRAYRIWAMRRALIAAVLVPFAIHVVSAWAFGAGAPGLWLTVAGLAYGVVAAATIVSWPAFVLPILPVAAAAAALAAAAPWLDAGGSLGFDLSRAASLTIICALSMALSIALGFLRLKGPLEFIARQSIAAPPDRVFEQMRAEHALASPEDGVTVARDGEKITVDYGGGLKMNVVERVDRRNGIIALEAMSADVPGMTSLALHTIRDDGRGGADIEFLERVWNAPLGVMAAYCLSGVLPDFARSHRDRIEGRHAVSVRDQMMRQNQRPN